MQEIIVKTGQFALWSILSIEHIVHGKASHPGFTGQCVIDVESVKDGKLIESVF